MDKLTNEYDQIDSECYNKIANVYPLREKSFIPRFFNAGYENQYVSSTFLENSHYPLDSKYILSKYMLSLKMDWTHT